MDRAAAEDLDGGPISIVWMLPFAPAERRGSSAMEVSRRL